MSITIYPIGFGCCQNVHLMVRFGNKTNPVLKLRLVGFYNIGQAYITEVIMSKNKENNHNVQEILKAVDDQLFIGYDFKLKDTCFPLKKQNTLEIITGNNLGIKPKHMRSIVLSRKQKLKCKYW